jgi:hypothetical protein
LSPEPKSPAPPVESPGSEVRNSAGNFFGKRSVLVAALIVSALWILGLVVLAAVSANPVTINQKQIRESHFIVTAMRDSSNPSTLVVTKEWFRGEELGTITVTNLDETNMTLGQKFLVPLQKLATGRFLVTPTSLPNKAPLVYRATPKAESQLKTLLESRAP